MTRTILVFGATGKFSGSVLPELSKRGAEVRAFIRNPEQRDAVLRRGASQVAVGDLTNWPSVERALEGIHAIFYIAPVFLSRQAEIGCRVVERAVAAGVRRIVFSSVIHPVLSKLPNHDAKAPVEEAVLDSSLEYTILHPSVFFQNFESGWPRIVETAVVAEPWSCETRFSRVNYRDVAEVAAIALTEDRFVNGTFDLCAEGQLNRHDIAALISEVLRRPVTAARIDPSTLGPEVDPIRPMFAHYDRVGLRSNPLTLRTLLGREPRTLRAYFEELARGAH